MTNYTQKCLDWITKRESPTLSECQSRWGHYFDHLVDEGLVKISEPIIIDVPKRPYGWMTYPIRKVQLETK